MSVNPCAPLYNWNHLASKLETVHIYWQQPIKFIIQLNTPYFLVRVFCRMKNAYSRDVHSHRILHKVLERCILLRCIRAPNFL